MNTSIKFLFIWFVLVMCIGVTASAQKLPNVQEKSVFATVNIKVDGKATEWGNQLQAYNKSTSLYYTIANNADNLYLVVLATDKTIIEKILAGGIALTISSSIDKNIQPVMLVSPVLSPIKRGPIVSKLRSPELDINTELASLNKTLVANFKEMSISGIPAITDSTISVYNNLGIKMMGQFDLNKAYTCEITIPLKYLSPLQIPRELLITI